MDHFKILRRAYHITLNYRALWIFGILLALASPSSSGGSSSGGGSSGGGFFPPPGNFHGLSWNIGQIWPRLAGILVVLICLVLLLAVVFTILRYLSETSLIRMVDRYETDGQTVSVREGFRLGWSRAAFRIFLTDLVIGFVGVLAFLLLSLIAAAPLLVWRVDSQAAHAFGTALSIGLFLLVLLLFITAAIVFSIALQFIHRAVILEDLGVGDAIRRGFSLVRSRLGDVVVMALLLLGLSIAWVVVMIPVFLLLALAGLVLGGLPGLLVGGIARLFAEGALPYILGALVGVPIFLLVVMAPILVLSGLYETYQSSVWTLTFREVKALEGPGAAPLAPSAAAE
jgi:hypothetical protein